MFRLVFFCTLSFGVSLAAYAQADPKWSAVMGSDFLYQEAYDDDIPTAVAEAREDRSVLAWYLGGDYNKRLHKRWIGQVGIRLRQVRSSINSTPDFVTGETIGVAFGGMGRPEITDPAFANMFEFHYRDYYLDVPIAIRWQPEGTNTLSFIGGVSSAFYLSTAQWYYADGERREKVRHRVEGPAIWQPHLLLGARWQWPVNSKLQLGLQPMIRSTYHNDIWSFAGGVEMVVSW